MTFIQPDPGAAAAAAAKEAEAAHVTPGAVMYSAPDGYGTGAGETFAPARIDPDDDENDRSWIAPMTETLQKGDIVAHQALGIGDERPVYDESSVPAAPEPAQAKPRQAESNGEAKGGESKAESRSEAKSQSKPRTEERKADKR